MRAWLAMVASYADESILYFRDTYLDSDKCVRAREAEDVLRVAPAPEQLDHVGCELAERALDRPANRATRPPLPHWLKHEDSAVEIGVRLCNFHESGLEGGDGDGAVGGKHDGRLADDVATPRAKVQRHPSGVWVRVSRVSRARAGPGPSWEDSVESAAEVQPRGGVNQRASEQAEHTGTHADHTQHHPQ